MIFLQFTGFKDLVAKLHKLIKGFGKLLDQKLVVVLDSVDQLRKNDAAFNLSW